ncbi:MAG: ribose 5-phosphate isomerase B [Planctomycetes bacterium]|nr:ribose 5-phosphate isomerase B [Planctomycetota bacterium]
MKIAIASDHAGYKTKELIKTFLKENNHSYQDFGADSEDSVDYPDYAFKVAEAVGRGEYERGILICGTGLGMCIAANKVKGIRAVACHNESTAEMSRQHNDANILCLGARVIEQDKMKGIIKVWLQTEFEGDPPEQPKSFGRAGRHQRRIDKISEHESL